MRPLEPSILRTFAGGLVSHTVPGAQPSASISVTSKLASIGSCARASVARAASSVGGHLKARNSGQAGRGQALPLRERLAVSASRRRYESPSMAMTSAWWTTRSMRAVAQAALGKIDGHSANGRLVVSTRLLCS